MTTSTIDFLAAQQYRARRRQRLLQHGLFGLLGLALLGGALRMPFSTSAPSGVEKDAMVEALAVHGPSLPATFHHLARRATALAVARTPVALKSTRVRKAVDFDPEAFHSAEGMVLEEGIASFYGAYFEGRPTANGEAFEPDGLSAAHRTLPLGSIIRVTNLRNNRQVVVRVNDRGPYVGDRVLDLSRGAAEVLGMRARGTARVRIEVL